MKSVRLALALCTLFVTGCAVLESRRGPVRHITTWEGFDVPECVYVDNRTGAIYISNIEADEGRYWDDDGKGFLSRVSRKGKRTMRWSVSTRRVPIHAPKGMCIPKKYLYFTDNSRLMACDAVTGSTVQVMAKGFEKANDLATDGTAVWLSDTATDKVWRIAGKTKREIPAPEGVNGLACHDGRLFAVSWSLHDLYELDPSGTAAPEPFGLADQFVNLDGIEVLGDGSFIVSDFKGNKICHVGADRATVTTLIEVTSPADIGLDRRKRLLYVPSFDTDRVEVYRLNLP